jgi:hypothetical protein
MKIPVRIRRMLQSGSSLLMTLVIITATLLLLAATLQRTVTVSKLNDRSNLYLVGNSAAEAATEKVLSRMMVDFANGGLTALTNNLSYYQTQCLPSSTESAWWANFSFSDAQGNSNQTYVGQTTTNSNTPYVALQYQYPGLNAFAANYRVISNVRPSFAGNYNFTNAVQQDVQMAEIPVFQFAIFYSGILEFSGAGTLTIVGRVQCNSNMYVGSSSPLTFSNFVSVSGIITNPAMCGEPQSSWTGAVNYKGLPTPGWGTGEPVLTLPVGTNSSSATSVQQILYPPPSGESSTNPISSQRYYNNAYMAVMVSNTGVTVSLRNASYDSNAITIQSTNWIYWTTNNWSTWTTNLYGTANSNVGNFGISSWLMLSTNSGVGYTNYGVYNTNGDGWLTNALCFYDARQAATNRTTQIDVGQLGNWINTNAMCAARWPSGNAFNGILYVGDWRSNSTANTMEAVRLINGSIINTNGMPAGLTVCTPNPLYVWSDYNAPSAATHGGQDVAGTSPCSFACDALTLLSAKWSDVNSWSHACSSRTGSNMTVNAAFIAGNVPSTGSSTTTYSGGAENLPRLLENWGSTTLTLNTSILCLYPSSFATNQFVEPTGSASSDYYEPPTRNFTFNTNYATVSGLPPGTPKVDRMIRATWCNPPPNTITYSPWTNPIPVIPQ